MTADPVTSTGNPRLKDFRAARDGKNRDHVLIEGQRLLDDALGSGLSILVCLHPLHPPAAQTALLAKLGARGALLIPAATHVLESVSDTRHPQGLIALVRRPDQGIERLTARVAENSAADFFVALDGVQDPGNTGTILRTAEAAGCQGALLLGGTADPWSPKALRSSMGSALRLPMATGVAAAELIAFANEHELRLVAADSSTAPGAKACREFDWTKPLLLVLGSEGSGVRPELLAACHSRVHIPLAPQVESLNVASAAAVLLFEAAASRTQRGASAPRSKSSPNPA
jgi:TrmH family RNA methyltransferase